MIHYATLLLTQNNVAYNWNKKAFYSSNKVAFNSPDTMREFAVVWLCATK